MKGRSCWITRQSWWRPWSQGSSVLLLATLLRLTHPTGTICSSVVHPSYIDFFLSHVYYPPSAGISETPTLKTAPRTSTHASISSDQTLWRGHLDQAQSWTLNLFSEIPTTGWHIKTQSGCPTHTRTDKQTHWWQQMEIKQHLHHEWFLVYKPNCWCITIKSNFIWHSLYIEYNSTNKCFTD